MGGFETSTSSSPCGQAKWSTRFNQKRKKNIQNRTSTREVERDGERWEGKAKRVEPLVRTDGKKGWWWWTALFSLLFLRIFIIIIRIIPIHNPTTTAATIINHNSRRWRRGTTSFFLLGPLFFFPSSPSSCYCCWGWVCFLYSFFSFLLSCSSFPPPALPGPLFPFFIPIFFLFPLHHFLHRHFFRIIFSSFHTSFFAFPSRERIK